VACSVGPWHPNAHLYDKKETISGTILEPVGKSEWHVLCDNGHKDKNVAHPSCVLKKLPSNNEFDEENNDEDEFFDAETELDEDTELGSELIERVLCDDLSKKIEEYDNEILKTKEEIKYLVGKTFQPTTGDIRPLWLLVPNINSTRTTVVERKSSFLSLSKKRFDVSTLFWDLWPGDIDEQIEKLNKIAEECIALRCPNGMLNLRWKPVSKEEMKTFILLFSVAAGLSQKGVNLF